MKWNYNDITGFYTAALATMFLILFGTAVLIENGTLLFIAVVTPFVGALLLPCILGILYLVLERKGKES